MAPCDELLNDFHAPSSLWYHLDLEIFNLSLGRNRYVCPSTVLSCSNYAYVSPVIAKLAGRHWSCLEILQRYLTKSRKIYGYGIQCLLAFESFQVNVRECSHLRFSSREDFQKDFFLYFLRWDHTATFPLSLNATELLFPLGLLAFTEVVRTWFFDSRFSMCLKLSSD